MHQRFLNSKRNEPSTEGALHRSEAGCRNLLKDGHHKRQTLAALSLPFCECETFLKIEHQRLVKHLFGGGHRERLGEHLSSCEQGGTVRATGISLCASDDDGVESVPLLNHLCRRIEKGWVKHLHEHPEAEVVALVGRCREQHQVAGMLLQHLGQLEVLRLYELTVLAIRREMVRLIEYNQVPRRCRF